MPIIDTLTISKTNLNNLVAAIKWLDDAPGALELPDSLFEQVDAYKHTCAAEAENQLPPNTYAVDFKEINGEVFMVVEVKNESFNEDDLPKIKLIGASF